MNYYQKPQIESYYWLIAIVMLIGFIILVITTPNAFGATVVGITLSKSCQASLSCPSYEDLVKTYDNTNQYISGEFVYDENGDLKRQPSRLKNHYLYYTHPQQFIFAVDPDAQWISRGLNYHVVLEPYNFTYTMPSDNIIINNTRYEYQGRWIDSCSFSRIYYELLQDTLNFLLSNCKITSYDETKTIIMPTLPVNYQDHEWYRYNAWLNQVMKDCKLKC